MPTGAGEVIDLGSGVIGTIWYRPDGTVYGLAHTHPRPDNGEQCEGLIPFQQEEAPPPTWLVVNRDPAHLTLIPSSLCRTCGHHGFVTDGKWVPA
jgi:hypothetical protein